MSYLSQLNLYSNLITAISTAVLAFLTAVLWFENRRLRKAGSSPEIVAYLLPHPDGHGGINFVLANVGKGPAFDITFELIYDEKDFIAHDAKLLNDPERKPISVLAQDEKIRALIGVSYVLYGNVNGNDIGPLKPFTVRIRYSDIFGRKIKRDSALDIRQFAGLAGVLEKSNERKVSESLEKIEKHMAKIAQQSSHLHTLVDITRMRDAYVQKAKGNPRDNDDG